MSDSDGTMNATGLMPKLSIMLFLQFWIWGAWFLTIPNYLMKIDYMAIGASPWYAFTAHPIAAMIAPFFVGLIADRFFNTEKLLSVLFLVAGAIMLCMPTVANLQGVVQVIADPADVTKTVEVLEVSWLGMTMYKHVMFEWLILVHMLFYMPTLALTASLCFSHLPKGSSQYPLVRLWGTFGWIFAGLALPFFYNQYEVIDGLKQVTVKAGETTGQFTLAGWGSIGLGIFALFLPKTPAPKKGEKVDVAALLFMDVWKEFKRPSFAVFVICSFLICIPLQAYYAYLQTQMTEQGFTNISIWKNAGTWIEAFMMFSMPFFFRKLGVKKMIAIGIGAWALRYALFPIAANYGIIPADAGFNINGFQVPITHMGFILVILGVALHGLCYDFFFVTGQIYVDQTTDIKMRAQAQSMLIFFTQGLGMYVGAKLNADLFQKAFANKEVAGAEKLKLWGDFWWPLCIMAVVVLIVFIFAFKHKSKSAEGVDGEELEDAEFSH